MLPEEYGAGAGRKDTAIEQQLGPESVEVRPVQRADQEHHQLEHTKYQPILRRRTVFFLCLHKSQEVHQTWHPYYIL